MPITYNWVWSHKKLCPFVGVGISPIYILTAQTFGKGGDKEKGVTHNYEGGGGSSILHNYSGIEGFNRFKISTAFEIGFQPFKHTILSVRSSLGIYRNHLSFLGPTVGMGGSDLSQNTNMFSLLAKVYLRK